ncbi:MAG: aggregation factor core [Pseudomonadota bacterium]
MRMPLILAALTLTAGAATADVAVSFREGAPVDRFFLENTGDCDLGQVTVTFDLSTSAAGLIFDVTAAGAGVEVYQPVVMLTEGNVSYNLSPVTDGMQLVAVELSNFDQGMRIGMSADVDDTLAESALGQIRVAGSEIAGAQVILNTPDGEVTAAFDTAAQAVLPTPPCVSS